jgi:hypothetical protein
METKICSKCHIEKVKNILSSDDFINLCREIVIHKESKK